ncbi:MAG: copper homeostasis protein CutC [Planctomycetota bacterium]
MTPILEVCLSNATDAITAAAGGALRVELCANLAAGGVTPSCGEIAVTRHSIAIGLQVLIRPREGDFVYSSLEVDAMVRDIEACRTLGCDGVVIGALTRDGSLDEPAMRRMIESAGDLSITCHRAFDSTPDPFATLEQLADWGVHHVLTSGQAPSARAGASTLRDLQARAGDRLIVLAGGSVSVDDVSFLLGETGLRELHVGSSVTESRESSTDSKSPGLGPAGAIEVGRPGSVSEAKVRRFVEAMASV